MLGRKTHRSVFRFDIMTRAFAEAPRLNVARCSAGSCVLNGKLYAVSGIDSSKNKLNTIECLDVAGGGRKWEMHTIAALEPRSNPLVSPLTETQFMIAGGSDKEDVLVVDEFTLTAKKVLAEGSALNNCCYARGFMVQPGLVISVVNEKVIRYD